MTVRVLVGDTREVLKQLPDESVHCIVTSPPYFGLRSYLPEGHPDKAKEIGLEQTPEAYVAELVSVFREARRVLRSDGTVWVNLGDSYNARPGQRKTTDLVGAKQLTNAGSNSTPSRFVPGLKPKDLIGIPWRVAFALQADGWWLRSDIIWHKANPMPEIVTDRPTSAHEHMFLLAKSSRYYFDADAVREAGVEPDRQRADRIGGANGHLVRHSPGAIVGGSVTRNIRNVWTIATQPFADAHFAVFPPALVEPCIKAGTSEKGCCPHCGAPWVRDVERTLTHPCGRTPYDSNRPDGRTLRAGDFVGGSVTTLGWSPSCSCPAHQPIPCTVLDCFGGAGTTALVADRLQRNAILIELNPAYADMARRRLATDRGPLIDALESEAEP